MPRLPLTDVQWQLYRAKMEEIAAANEHARTKLNPVEMAEMMLILMDRIDDLEKKLSA